jgi:hypothetical protein
MNPTTAPVWVIAEEIGGVIPMVCFELLGKANELGKELKRVGSPACGQAKNRVNCPLQ